MPFIETPTTVIPPSWDLKSWSTQAPHVWPHSEDRARRVVRTYWPELSKAYAVVKIGRTLVVMGEAYQQWLAAHPCVTDEERRHG